MEKTALKVVQHNELVKVGRRSVSVRGYTVDLVEQHLKWHLGEMSKKWCTPECMSRTMFGRNSKPGCEGIRRRTANTFRELLQRGLFLVIEYDATPSGHGRIKAFKIFEDGAGVEQQYAQGQIERMTRRGMVTEEMRARALNVIGK